MIASERRIYILGKLSERGTISLTETAKELHTSVATVRRDFDSLAKEDYIERVHGGLILKESMYLQKNMYNNNAALALKQRQKTNEAEKRTVAQAAASLVNDGDFIYLDTGTSIAAIVDFLLDKKISIVTPNLLILDRIRELEVEMDIVLIGGKCNIAHGSTVGPISVQFIQQFNFDKAFFGCYAIDLATNMASDDVPDSWFLKVNAFNNTNDSYLLADSSKLNKKSFYKFTEISKFKNVFCNTPKNSDYRLPSNFITLDVK
ncbi:MAG: DeoR/GlpR transcriptional regulator [Erysipelotrichaceae bacterium]|nr:DeoR/GlpR transcriptional regulator [Erysipelotrichaceae bacterium]